MGTQFLDMGRCLPATSQPQMGLPLNQIAATASSAIARPVFSAGSRKERMRFTSVALSG
jgi:hypothetical protein